MRFFTLPMVLRAALNTRVLGRRRRLTMRCRLLLPLALAVLLLSPAFASAAPTLYVCTPSGQILTYDASTQTTAVFFTGTGNFAGPYNDCTVAPDGSVFVAAGAKILRVSASDQQFFTLPSAAKGLAFNVTTLFVSTVSGTVYKLVFNDSNPLTLKSPGGGPDPVGNTDVSPLQSGQGVVFDQKGNAIVAGASKLYQSAPPLSGDNPYGPPSELVSSGIAPWGVALLGCRNIAVADTTTDPVTKKRYVKRLTSSGLQTISGLEFGGKDIPLYIETVSRKTASANAISTMYIVTGEDLAGSNAKIWRADFGSLTNCSSATLTQLVALKDLTTGRNPILTSASAIGIAAALVAPSDSPTINQTFTSNDCNNPTKKFDFGGHAVTLTFLDCANTFPPNQSTTFSVTAVESLPSDVRFAPNFPLPPPIEGMRYSPEKGLIVQYVIEKTGYNPFVNGPHPLRLVYQFFTQENIATPGVARAANTGVTDFFTESVGNDFWDAGVLDPPAGERGDTCCSKRVVFNTPTQNNNACTLVFGSPLQPGGVQNPQFNSGQNFTVNVNVLGGCTGGTLRVSIFQNVGGTFVPITVTSNVQTDNIMDPNGPSSFKYGIDTTNLATGQYRLTVWGTVGAPVSHDFSVQK